MSKICKNCGTTNEDKFSYCKNCGTPLDATEQKNANNPYMHYDYTDTVPNHIDGIPTEEVCAFVGPNKRKIVEKFSKMSITGSKISWCWPAAILSFFFGFFGAAFWLFYRKMYKYGSIALAIGLIILGLNTVITYKPTLELIDAIMNALNGFRAQTPNIDEIISVFENALDNFSAAKAVLFTNFITETANYCAAIIYGIFGMFLYKKHAVKKISNYRSVNLQSEYYGYGIRAIGGVSGGMMALSIVLAVVLQNIINSIPIFFHILF